MQEAIRAANGIQKLVGLLAAGPDADCTHRALLALRIVTDREADRHAILKVNRYTCCLTVVSPLLALCNEHKTLANSSALRWGGLEGFCDPSMQAGGIPQLVKLLSAGPDSEITEYAAAALGNLAAGGHALKDAIRGVSPSSSPQSAAQAVPLQTSLSDAPC